MLCADETTLTLFNTTSDQSSAYPLFMSTALLPKAIRRKACNLVNIALLPKFLKRFHPGSSTMKMAALKRRLTWTCITVALQALLEDAVDVGPLPGYWCVMHTALLCNGAALSCVFGVSPVFWAVCFTVLSCVACASSYQGTYKLFGEAALRRVFLVPFLYLAGTRESGTHTRERRVSRDLIHP